MNVAVQLAEFTKFIIPSFLVRTDGSYNPTYVHLRYVLGTENMDNFLFFYKGKWREIISVVVVKNKPYSILLSGLTVVRKFNSNSGFWITHKRKDILDAIEKENYWFQRHNKENLENLFFREYRYNGTSYNVRAYGKNKDIKNDKNYQWQRKCFPGTLPYRQIIKKQKARILEIIYENRTSKKR